MWFLGVPIRNLVSRPMRSGLSVLGIAFAVGSFIALVGMSRGVEHAWIRSLVERDTHVMAIRRGTVEILTASLDERVGDQLRAIEGVRDVAGELADLVRLESGQLVLVTGWSPGGFLWSTLRLSEGRLPHESETTGAVLGRAVAHALRVRPGDTLHLLGSRLTVTAVFQPNGVMNNNSLILPLSILQTLLNRPGRVTVFNLRLDRPDDPETIKRVLTRLSSTFPDLTFTETRFVADQNDFLRLIRAMAWGTSTVALIMGLFVVLNTLLMSVSERTREFGVLSAVGWGPERVLTMIVIEGLALSTVGSVIGTMIGIGGLAWLTRMPLLQGFLEPEVSVRLLCEVSAAALVLGVIGSIYPAWRAVRLHPVEALKYE